MITTQIDDLVGRPTGVKTQAFLYVLCGLAEAAVYVALLPLLRSLIAGDYVAAGYLVALAAALALLHSVIGFFADNRGYYIGIEQICHALQDALGDHIVRLPLGWFTKERSGQVAALLTKELQMAMDVPSTFLRQMVIAVTTPAAVVVLFLFVDWRIGLVFVIAAPLLLWASRAMAKAAGEGHRQEELSNAEVAARVLEFAHAQPVLRATKRSVEGWDALQQAIERDRAATVATLRMASAPVARYTMLIQVVFAVVFATATALLAWGQIDVASYVFVAVLSLRLVDPLTLIGSQGMALRVAKNALDASEGILKTPPLPETRNPRVPCGSSVAFDRVGFAYEESRPGWTCATCVPTSSCSRYPSCSRTCTCSTEPSRRTCWRGAPTQRPRRRAAPRTSRALTRWPPVWSRDGTRPWAREAAAFRAESASASLSRALC